MKSERILLIALIISMCIWGLSWSSAKVLSGYGSAASIAFLRFSLTIITLTILLPIFKVSYHVKKEGYLYVVGAGVLMLFYSLLFFGGLKVGLPGAGGVLVTTLNPIFAYLIGLVISRVVPKKMELIGLLIGIVAGLVLLKVWVNLDAIFSFGNSYFLVAAFLWALMSKITSHANRFGNAMSFSLWLHVTALLGFFFYVDLKEVVQILTHGDQKFWLNLLYFGTINSALATTCFLYASAKLGAERASTFIFIVPTMAVVGSLIFHNEAIQWHTLLGGVLGIIAVLVINGKFSRDTKSI